LILFLFFRLLSLGFVLENPLEHHIHILRKGTVALLCKHLDSFNNVMIKCKAYILLHRSIPFVLALITLDYISSYCFARFHSL